MNLGFIEWILILNLILIITLLFLHFRQRTEGGEKELLIRLSNDINKVDSILRQEFQSSREEAGRNGMIQRQELMNAFKNNEERSQQLFAQIKHDSIQLNEIVMTGSKANRDELKASLKSFEENFSRNVNDFNELQRQKFSDMANKQDLVKQETETRLERIRETIESKLQFLQVENAKKLEEMRLTVDEKLHATLETRFNESFKVISDRLELVHKGLGEMQSLANNVGDLKKVMTNVKTRGVMGEYQLANLLEDLLTNEQYEKNVKTKQGSGAIVEFAIKMPHGHTENKSLWLPIDSKFPKEDYENLQDAYEAGDVEKIDHYRKAFRQAIIKNAKDIRDKYIDPPNTTEYGLMFLPFESLYAEVLRTHGLFDQLQRDYKITVTGPVTLSALLNSLQMGFRTLAIEKRSGEVWEILKVIQQEFGQFGLVLSKTKKKLQEAANTIESAERRSRVLEGKLNKVQELPQANSKQVTAGIETTLNFDGDFGDMIQSVDEESDELE